MTAVVFLILRHSAISTRREEPHAEHVSNRGRVSEAASPTWPQPVQATWPSWWLLSVGGDKKNPRVDTTGG
jgi:hypothetical protein